MHVSPSATYSCQALPQHMASPMTMPNPHLTATTAATTATITTTGAATVTATNTAATTTTTTPATTTAATTATNTAATTTADDAIATNTPAAAAAELSAIAATNSSPVDTRTLHYCKPPLSTVDAHSMHAEANIVIDEYRSPVVPLSTDMTSSTKIRPKYRPHSSADATAPHSSADATACHSSADNASTAILTPRTTGNNSSTGNDSCCVNGTTSVPKDTEPVVAVPVLKIGKRHISDSLQQRCGAVDDSSCCGAEELCTEHNSAPPEVPQSRRFTGNSSTSGGGGCSSSGAFVVPQHWGGGGVSSVPVQRDGVPDADGLRWSSGYIDDVARDGPRNCEHYSCCDDTGIDKYADCTGFDTAAANNCRNTSDSDLGSGSATSVSSSDVCTGRYTDTQQSTNYVKNKFLFRDELLENSYGRSHFSGTFLFAPAPVHCARPPADEKHSKRKGKSGTTTATTGSAPPKHHKSSKKKSTTADKSERDRPRTGGITKPTKSSPKKKRTSPAPPVPSDGAQGFAPEYVSLSHPGAVPLKSILKKNPSTIAGSASSAARRVSFAPTKQRRTYSISRQQQQNPSTVEIVKSIPGEELAWTDSSHTPGCCDTRKKEDRQMVPAPVGPGTVSTFLYTFLSVTAFCLCVLYTFYEWNATATRRELLPMLRNLTAAACTPDSSNNHRLIHIDCPLQNMQTFYPPTEFSWNVDPHVGVFFDMRVEMYQWTLKAKRDFGLKVGGSWSDRAIEYSYFKHFLSDLSGKHFNPDYFPHIAGAGRHYAEDVHAGGFALPTKYLTKFQDRVLLPVRDDGYYKAPESRPPPYVDYSNTHAVDGKYLYSGDPEEPQIGDLRISFWGSNATHVSAIAMQKPVLGFTGTQYILQPFQQERTNKTLDIVMEGDLTAEELYRSAVEAAEGERWLPWALRGATFVVMFLFYFYGQLICGKSSDCSQLPMNIGSSGLFALATLSFVSAILWFTCSAVIGAVLAILSLGSFILGITCFTSKGTRLDETPPEMVQLSTMARSGGQTMLTQPLSQDMSPLPVFSHPRTPDAYNQHFYQPV